MKFNKTITFGLAVHAGLALVLVSQAGCSTIKMPWTSDDEEHHTHASTDEMPSMYLDEVKEEKKVADADDGFMPLDAFQADPEAPTDHEFANHRPAAGYHVPVRQAPRRPDWDLFPEDTAPSSTDYWNQPGVVSGKEYTVVKGDSLWAISKKQGVRLDALMSANGLNKSSVLRIGQVLTIPGEGGAQKRSTKPAYTTSGKTYTVSRGDTLSAIARRHNVGVRDLQNANSISGHMIYEGQTLNIPSSSAGYKTRADHQAAKRFQPTTEAGSYTVQPGDNLSNIAKRYNTTVSSLMANNNISDPRKLRAGQKLKVTGSGFKPVASTSKAPKAAKPGYYRVSQGDNLISIARKHNTTVADLMTWNGIEDARTLRAGQEIRVSGPAYTASKPAPAPAAPVVHRAPATTTETMSFDSSDDLFSETSQADLLEMDTMDLFGDIDGLFDDGEQADLVSVVE